MVGRRLFVRRRDGRIEVKLNDVGRSIAREAFGHVVAAQRDPNHDWHASLSAPIDPSSDQDDPVATLNRQHDMATNAELAVMTLNDEFLNDSEAWAWFCTLQVALRSTAVAHGLMDEAHLEAADPELLGYIRNLQQFLFELAECL